MILSYFSYTLLCPLLFLLYGCSSLSLSCLAQLPDWYQMSTYDNENQDYPFAIREIDEEHTGHLRGNGVKCVVEIIFDRFLIFCRNGENEISGRLPDGIACQRQWQ